MEPIKIGWLGSALDGPGGGYDKIHRLAFDDAVDAEVLGRPYEFVIHPENGLPHGSAKNAIDGFKSLVDDGCIVVAGAYSSDNAMVVGPYANELQVPLLSWCGTERFHGEYCFRLGNGDCGGDAALVVSWLKRNGHERVAVLTGIDQWCPDNPHGVRFHERYVERHGEDPPMWPNAIPLLAYDTAQVLVEALHRAPVLTGWGVKEGFEKIRFMPAATGGPRTHIAGGPFDHQLFKGDWLHYGRIENGKLEFAGLFESSAAPSGS
jgi:hypothetical protein